MKTKSFLKKLGTAIVDVRRDNVVSQEKLAVLSFVDKTYMARIEEGKANPSLKVVHKICGNLGLSFGELAQCVYGLLSFFILYSIYFA